MSFWDGLKDVGTVVGGAAVGGPWGAQAALGYLGDQAQGDAQKEAQAQSAQAIAQAQLANTSAAYTANGLLAGAMPGVQSTLGQGYQQASDLAAQGFGQQRQDILQSGQMGADAINAGFVGGRDALYGGATQGVGYLNSGLQSGVSTIDQGIGSAGGALYSGTNEGIGYIGSGLEGGLGAIGGRTDRSGAMLDQSGGLYGNYQADPGYQFRLQQGEDALRRMQAAQGGRFGGAAMKALVDYNQNMASQEFGNYVNRANSEFGAASSADDRSLAAGNSVAGLYGSAANQAAGLSYGAGQGMADIYTQGAARQADMYGNTASQAAGMAYGAGQGAAGLYGQAGSNLADIYGRTGTQLGNEAATAGTTLGSMAQDYYGGLANLDYGLAQQQGQNFMGAAQANMGLTPSIIANNNSAVPYAGAGWANAANAVGGATNGILALYGMGAFGGGKGYGPGL